MPNFAQNSVVMSSMATKKYIWAYFRRKSMDLGPKKYTSQIEVPCPTPEMSQSCSCLINSANSGTLLSQAREKSSCCQIREGLDLPSISCTELFKSLPPILVLLGSIVS